MPEEAPTRLELTRAAPSEMTEETMSPWAEARERKAVRRARLVNCMFVFGGWLGWKGWLLREGVCLGVGVFVCFFCRERVVAR